MNILYYDWNSCNSWEDVISTFFDLGYDCTKFSHAIKDKKWENDEVFCEFVTGILEKEEFQYIFSFDYFPVISKVAQQKQIIYISWIFDSPHLTLLSETIYNSCNRIFCFDRKQFIELKEKGIEHAYHMVLGVNNVRLDRQLGALRSDNSYIRDVCFVGSLKDNNLLSKDDLKQQLHPYVKGYLESIAMVHTAIPELDIVSEVTKELSKYIVIHDDGEGKALLSAGERFDSVVNERISELERKKILNELAKYYKVTLYTWSKTKIDVLNNVETFGPVSYLEEMPHIFRQSKINLNISMRGIESGIPLRILDICACGGFCITNYQPELEEYFELGKDLVVYESVEDLTDKVGYYLSHENQRYDIAKNGYEKVKKEFDYKTQIKKIMQIVRQTE
jgi:spore maturation protein CgeB